MLRRRTLVLLLVLAFFKGRAQQLSLGNTPYAVNKAAVLELNSTRQGLLLPRLTDTTGINALNPPDGMVVYYTPTKQFLLRANGYWNPLTAASSLTNYWATGGNANGAAKAFGNADNFDLSFLTNNAERMRLTATGRLGLGTSSPSSLLHVVGTNPLSLTGVQTGTTTTADSLLTINNGLVQKLPVGTFQDKLTGTGFVKSSGGVIAYDNNTYTVANAAITGATKTKITYDSKGLVTAGADATTTDIAEGSNLYYTDVRVRTAALTGFSAATTTAVTATDNVLSGFGKLQGQINALNSAGYLTGNQTIALSGDVTGSGTTSITTSIGANKVTLNHLAQVGNGTFLGRTSAGTGNVEALTTAQAKTLLGLTGTNSGDLSLTGQTYLSLSGQTLTANAVDLSGSHATGTLAAARFGALTGDVTNTAGSYATTIAAGAVTYSKMQNVSANNRLLGRATSGAGSPEEIIIGSGLALSGNTLTATAATGGWNTLGNAGTNSGTNFLGTTDNVSLRLRTANVQRVVVDSLGRVGIGVTNPTNPLVVKDTMEIRRTGGVSSLLFSNTAGTGDFRIGGDGGDIFWQGGGGRSLQTGAYWTMILAGDRQTASFPAFANGTGGTGVLIPAQRTGSVPLAVQAIAGQTANLMEWRSPTGTLLGGFNSGGYLGIGSPTFDGTNPEKLLINGGTTSSFNLIKGKASINNYLQLNIQNMSSGNAASSDIVATADNGSETNNYIDMGINGSGYAGGFFGEANDAYLYSLGQDLLIGNATANKGLYLLTGGSDKTANTRLYINGDGSVGIGTTSFDAASPEALKIDAGSSTYTPVYATGNYPGYFQINVKNTNTGTQGSSDLVATADNGTETTNFVNLGINGSGYVYQTGNPIETGKANDGYLISSGNDLYIVNNNATKDIIFLAGGTAPANEAMRITAAERIGIGTSSPNASTKLDVNGAVKVGTAGSVVKNMITAAGTFTSTQNISGASMVSISNSMTPAFLDVTYTLPAANTLSSTQATVSVSPNFDLPTGVSIAFARAISTTQVKVRFVNNSTSAQSLASGNKLYFTITEF